jgi:plasmid stability protein
MQCYVAEMATLTIRNLDEDTMTYLRARAARKGTSVEQESLAILQGSESAWEAISRLRDAYGTFDISVPERTDVAGEALE